MLKCALVTIASLSVFATAYCPNLYAQAGERPILAASEKTALENQATIAERVYAQEPDYQKALKLWKTRETAGQEASRLGIRNQTRETYINGRVTAMEAALNTKSFGSTLPAAVLQDGLSLATKIKGGTHTLNWATNNLPELKPDFQMGDEVLGKELIQAAQDTTHPKHKTALDLMVRYVGWQPTQPIHRQRKMAEAFDQEAIKKSLHLNADELKFVNENLGKLARGVRLAPEVEKQLMELFEQGLRKAFAQQQEQLKKMRKDIAEKGPNSEYWNNLDSKQQAEYYSQGLYETDQALRGFAGIARLMNNNAAAGKLYQSAVIFSAVRTSILETTGKSFASNPGTYLNVYVGIALAINDLMSSGGKSEMAGLFAQLREIAQQIAELRKEMNERFDLLDMKMKSQFEHTNSLLQAIALGGGRTESLISELKKTLANSHFEIMTGIKSLSASQESTFVTDCLLRRQSPQMVERCSAHYYAMAQNAVSSSANGNEVSAVELRQVRDGISKIEPTLPIRSMEVHPATWLYSADSILKLYKLNPDKILFAGTPTSLNPGWSITGMINSGKDLVTSLEGLLLIGSQNDLRLNTVLLDKLLVAYQENALHHFREGEKLGRQPDGPNPFVGVSQIPFDTEYSFYNRNIDFCSDAPVKAVQINEKNYRDDRIGHQTRYFLRSNLRTTLTLLTPGFAKGSPQITELLPKDVIWALIMGRNRELKQDGDFANVTVTPCWKEISIPKFHVTNASFNGQVKFELNLQVTYQRFGREMKTFTVVKSSYSENVQHRSADFSRSPHTENCNFIWRKWNANAFCPHDNSTGYHWEPIAPHVSKHFKPELIHSPEYKEFQRYFQEVQSFRQKQALRKFEEQYEQTSMKSVNVDSKRLLFLTVFLGVTSNTGSVDDLLSFISLKLPSNREVAELGLRGESQAQIERALTERINSVREKIAELAKDPTLEPRVDEYNMAIQGLERLKTGQR